MKTHYWLWIIDSSWLSKGSLYLQFNSIGKLWPYISIGHNNSSINLCVSNKHIGNDLLIRSGTCDTILKFPRKSPMLFCLAFGFVSISTHSLLQCRQLNFILPGKHCQLFEFKIIPKNSFILVLSFSQLC